MPAVSHNLVSYFGGASLYFGRKSFFTLRIMNKATRKVQTRFMSTAASTRIFPPLRLKYIIDAPEIPTASITYTETNESCIRRIDLYTALAWDTSASRRI